MLWPWVIFVGQARLFPELVALLPDIQTQQNMYLAAHEYSKRKKQAYGDAGFDRLLICPLSGQILLEQDVAAHVAELEAMQVCTASPNLPVRCPIRVMMTTLLMSSRPLLPGDSLVTTTLRFPPFLD